MPDKITRSIIVKGDVKNIFSLWADFENFPHFMRNIKSVRKTGEKTSHWVMGSRLGQNFEWDARTTEFQENKRIAWNSINGDIKTSGQVTFNDLDQNQTEVTAEVQYVPPDGALGSMFAHLFVHPEKKMEEDLRQFKQFAER